MVSQDELFSVHPSSSATSEALDHTGMDIKASKISHLYLLPCFSSLCSQQQPPQCGIKICLALCVLGCFSLFSHHKHPLSGIMPCKSLIVHVLHVVYLCFKCLPQCGKIPSKNLSWLYGLHCCFLKSVYSATEQPQILVNVSVIPTATNTMKTDSTLKCFSLISRIRIFCINHHQ